MMPLVDLQLELFADYHQIYLEDEEADPEARAAVWTQDTVGGLLGLAEGLVVIGTFRNTTVPFGIKVFVDIPAFLIDEQNELDVILECDLRVSSKKIVVMGCTDYYPDALRIDLRNGLYRVRIYYANSCTLSRDGIDGDDFYEVHLWSSSQSQERKIIKDCRISFESSTYLTTG